MKKLRNILLVVFILLIGINVSAKDTVYSVNKFDDEKLNIIKDSYNKDNKVDGLITAGTYLKEKIEIDDVKYDNYQVMIVKYKNDGKVDWTYRYGKTSSENITNILYSYDSNNKVDGYLLTINNSYDITNGNNPTSVFVKLDLDGKLVSEKDSGLNSGEEITKLIETYSVETIVDGYIGISNSSIIKYDKDLNLVLRKDYHNSTYQNTSYLDITNIYEDSNIVGYAFIRKLELQANKYDVELLKYNEELTEEKIIKDNINNYFSYSLTEANNGFILYGITDEVKLKKGEKSYYIINYKQDGEELWESIGNTPIDEKKDIILYPMKKDKIVNYFLLSKNIDSSYEVIKLDEEGLFKKKIKKINNNYYDFISFSISKDEKVIYFVGQINCPEDDSCEYDTNSLFLISDEDKVIEVQDSTSRNIIIIVCIFIILTGIGIYVSRKKKLEESKKKKKKKKV